MTAPVVTTPNVQLDGLTMLYRVDGGPVPTDSNGVEWLLTKFDGWAGVPAPSAVSTTRINRVNHSGAFRSASYRGPRILSMELHVTAPDVQTLRNVEEQVNSICSDPAQLYPMVVTEGGLTRVVMVELNDAISSAPINWYSTHYAFALAAPDPRKHDNSWQSSIATLGVSSSGGLVLTSPGASYASPGADFGTVGSPSQASVHNFGTATARPFFAVQGPLQAPWQISDIGSGAVINCTRALGATDSMVINCDDFPAQGFPGRSAYLNTSISQRAAILVPFGWPKVLPGATNTYVLRSTSFTAATMTVSLRSVWN